MNMSVIRFIFSGLLPSLKQGSFPVQKTALRPFLNLISPSRGLKGVKGVDEKSPPESSQGVIYF